MQGTSAAHAGGIWTSPTRVWSCGIVLKREIASDVPLMAGCVMEMELDAPIDH
jgi:hypothetical protein